MVTHDEYVAHYAHRIVHFQDGEIVKEQTARGARLEAAANEKAAENGKIISEKDIQSDNELEENNTKSEAKVDKKEAFGQKTGGGGGIETG